MRYKVGDVVRVRYDLKQGAVYGGDSDCHPMLWVEPEMLHFAGKNVMIELILQSDLFPDKFMYRVAGSDWNWTDDMFEGYGFDSNDAESPSELVFDEDEFNSFISEFINNRK